MDSSSGAPAGGLTRRRLLTAAAVPAAALLAGAGYGVDRLVAGRGGLRSAAVSDGGAVARSFRSAPGLRPAVTDVRSGAAAAPGLMFVAPAAVGGSQSGPLIVDDRGEPVWFAPTPAGTWATNFTVQRYRDRPVLTWWEGKVISGYGHGEGVIADTSYREIARVRGAHGRTVDLHELVLSPAGTALFTCTPAQVRRDLSPIGGPADAVVLESVIQERDVASGRLVMEWRGLDHVGVAESHRRPSARFDYLHANSIDVLPDGDLLVSARHTWTLYKLDRRTGAVIWRLGGKRSDFSLGPGVRFAWQHDARQIAPGAFTVFDNGDDGVTQTEPQSRALRLDVDERRRRVTLARQYRHPSALVATAMGSVQALDDGHTLVGWGSAPWATEFDADGHVVTDLEMARTQKSYRGFRWPWTGAPPGRPALAAARDRRSGRATVYASWNGATAVARWRLEAGARASDLRTVVAVPRRGFETAVALGAAGGHVRVAALDGAGRVLGHSAVIRV